MAGSTADWAATTPISGLQNGSTIPTVGQALVWNGKQWAPATVSGGGGGTPSGPAGGDLSGNYPNPSLRTIGTPTGPIGDSLHVAQITIDGKGRVLTLASVAIATGGVGTVTQVNTGTGMTGGPITSSGTISLANTAVTPGSYTSANITVDAQGRITAASNGSGGGGGTVTQVNTGSGLTGGPITGTGTIALANVADNSVLANISGGSAAPSANTLSAIIDHSIGSTQGDILYRNASGWVVLAPGTSGQLLSSGGAAANPSWVTASGTGTVTSVATGSGLTGGPITASGTIALANVADGSVLANISGGSAAPSANTLSAIIDHVIGATQGDIIYRNASAWVVLAPGTAGQVLTTGGAAANPSWTAASGTGTVTSVATGTGLTGGPITTTGTISLANTAVTPGSYTNTNLTVDAQGRITAASNGTGGGTVTSVAVSGANGIGVSGSPITSSGTIALTLGDISSAQSKPSRGASVARTLATQRNDIFNVKDYGAAGDGATLDDSAIAAAIAALVAFSSGDTRGTLYFPDGTFKVSAEIAMALANEFTATIKGNGRFSSIILQSGAGANGIHVTITPVSTQARARVEICDLSVQSAPGVAGGNGIFIDYTSTVGSTEFVNGPSIERVDINTQVEAGSGGWNTGIKLNNVWKALVSDVTACGMPSASSIPTSGAGGNAFLVIVGGQNIIVDNVQASFFQYGFKLVASAAGVGISGTFTKFIFVVVGIGVWLLPQNYTTSLIFGDWLIDQGNSPNSGYANIGFLIDFRGTPAGFGQIIISRGNITQVGGSTGVLEVHGPCTQGVVSSVVAFTTPSFAHLYTGVDRWVFDANQMGNGAITLDSGATNNQFNNTQGSPWSDSGSGNTHITTLF